MAEYIGNAYIPNGDTDITTLSNCLDNCGIVGCGARTCELHQVCGVDACIVNLSCLINLACSINLCTIKLFSEDPGSDEIV